MITQEMLDNWFTYHPPTEEDKIKYVAIRDKAKEFAQIVIQNTPPSADQSAAIRDIRNAVMHANSSIACEGK